MAWRIPLTNFYIGRSLQQKRAQATKPEEVMVSEKLQKDRQRRVKEDIGTWRNALREAEDPYYPDRKQLNRLYRELVLDPHLSSVMETRKLNVMGKRFHIVDENGEEDEEATELVQGQWALSLMEMIMDSIFWGPTLVEFGQIEDGEFKQVHQIPRDYVLPERMEVRFDEYELTGERFDKEPMDLWLFLIGDPSDLGLLNKTAHPTLIKRASLSAWSEYNEVYGTPLIYAKTRNRSPKKQAQLESMLANFPEVRWGLFDLENDEINILEPSVGTQATFKDIIDQTNKEISKLVVGQTMTTEDGSSLSQSEVHERVMQGYEEADMRFVKSVWDKQILPRMQRMDLVNRRLFFSWDTKEQLTLRERFEFDKTIIQSKGYKLPPDYLEEMYGSPVQEDTSGGGLGMPTGMVGDADILDMTASFHDFPDEAVLKAQKALSYLKENRGKDHDHEARRIATKIAKREPIGKVGLQTIRKYADLKQYEGQAFDHSREALNFALVGGDAMVNSYAPEKIREAGIQERVAQKALKFASHGQGDRGEG